MIEAERPYNSSIKGIGACYYNIEQLIASEDALMLIAQVEVESAGELAGEKAAELQEQTAAKPRKKIVATGYAKIRTSKSSLSHEIDSYLGFMYVEPDHRGRGLNKELIDCLIAWSRKQGANDFYLDVYTENLPAVKAYIKAGFSSSIIEMKLNL